MQCSMSNLRLPNLVHHGGAMICLSPWRRALVFLSIVQIRNTKMPSPSKPVFHRHSKNLIWSIHFGSIAPNHAVNISTDFVRVCPWLDCSARGKVLLKCWLCSFGVMMEGYLNEDTAGWLIKDNLGFLAITTCFLQSYKGTATLAQMH